MGTKRVEIDLTNPYSSERSRPYPRVSVDLQMLAMAKVEGSNPFIRSRGIREWARDRPYPDATAPLEIATGAGQAC